MANPFDEDYGFSTPRRGASSQRSLYTDYGSFPGSSYNREAYSLQQSIKNTIREIELNTETCQSLEYMIGTLYDDEELRRRIQDLVRTSLTKMESARDQLAALYEVVRGSSTREQLEAKKVQQSLSESVSEFQKMSEQVAKKLQDIPDVPDLKDYAFLHKYIGGVTRDVRQNTEALQPLESQIGTPSDTEELRSRMIDLMGTGISNAQRADHQLNKFDGVIRGIIIREQVIALQSMKQNLREALSAYRTVFTRALHKLDSKRKPVLLQSSFPTAVCKEKHVQSTPDRVTQQQVSDEADKFTKKRKEVLSSSYRLGFKWTFRI